MSTLTGWEKGRYLSLSDRFFDAALTERVPTFDDASVNEVVIANGTLEVS